MFKLFISESSLEDFILNEQDKNVAQQDNWYKILQKQKNIYVLFDKNIDYSNLSVEEAQINPLFLLLQSGKEFIDSTSYLKDIENHSKNVLDNPCGAFLLDIDKTKADDIQKKYGVICQSTNSLNGSFWKSDIYNAHISISPNDKSHSWEEFLKGINSIPSNSLLIIDRYLFSYENDYKTTLEDGINNLFSILNSLLPDSFSKSEDYHVMLIFDGKELIEIKNSKFLFGDNSVHNIDECFAKLAKLISSKKKDLKRDYNILFELVSLTSDNFGYSDTHNRRILTNYCIIRADHLLKAFKNNLGTCEQNIDCDTLFSTGIDKNTKSDAPEKAHSSLLTALRSVFDYAKGDAAPNYKYALNKNGEKSIKDLVNRLFL